MAEDLGLLLGNVAQEQLTGRFQFSWTFIAQAPTPCSFQLKLNC